MTKPIYFEVKYDNINGTVHREIVRVINLIPEWDIKFRRGRPLKLPWNLPVN